MTAAPAQAWFVYIIQCADNTLYTGITPDIKNRIKTHNQGKGAKYTRGRTPVRLVYQKKCADKSAALKREIEIKKMARKKKMALLNLK